VTLSTPQQTTTTGRSDAEIEQHVLRFIEQHTKKSWDPATDLFASGAVSSLFALQLVMALEKAFDVSVAGDDLKLDNFRTVNAMVALVRRLQDEGSGE